MAFWANLIPAAIQVGAEIFGAQQAASANKKAAKQAQKAQENAARAIATGEQSALQSITATELEAMRQINAANQQAQGRFEGIRSIGLPSVQRLQAEAVRDPSQLSPAQKRLMDESRRQSIRRLEAGGLRGGGRALTRAVRETEADLAARLYDQNERNSRATAGALATPYFNATGNIAQLDTASGQTTGNYFRNIGAANAGAAQRIARAEAGAIETGGNIQAQSGLASAGIRGQALGDIGAVLANATKQSRYDDQVENFLSRIGAG